MPIHDHHPPIPTFPDTPLRNRDAGHGQHWVPCLFPHPENPTLLVPQDVATPILSFCHGCAPPYLRPPTPANYLAHIADARARARRLNQPFDEEAERAACAVVTCQTAHDGMAWADEEPSLAELRRVAAARSAVAFWGDSHRGDCDALQGSCADVIAAAAATLTEMKEGEALDGVLGRKRKGLGDATTNVDQPGGDRKRISPEKPRRKVVGYRKYGKYDRYRKNFFD